MAILVYTDIRNNTVKKNALESIQFARACADQCNVPVHVITGKIEQNTHGVLQSAGAHRVLECEALESYTDVNGISEAMASYILSQGIQHIVFSYDYTGKALAPILAGRLNAGLITGITHIPVFKPDGIEAVKTIFGGKASATYVLKSEIRILSVLPNSISFTQFENSEIQHEQLLLKLPLAKVKRIEVKQNNSGAMAPLPEAELVVSAGRGLKGPEHWGIIEDLAKVIGATTACSRPVADMHWRPHHEHVGQTGIAIRPNLYIAIGISGAIQHLAGVNGSKTIVVINTDKDAPFFKSADFGVIGDAFTVVPKLTEAINRFKNSNS